LKGPTSKKVKVYGRETQKMWHHNAWVNPCALDYVATKIIEFNYKLIKQMTQPFKRKNATMYPLVQFDINNITVTSNVGECEKIRKLTRTESHFSVSIRWKILELPDSAYGEGLS
jgi:hypothetical protein